MRSLPDEPVRAAVRTSSHGVGSIPRNRRLTWLRARVAASTDETKARPLTVAGLVPSGGDGSEEWTRSVQATETNMSVATTSEATQCALIFLRRPRPSGGSLIGEGRVETHFADDSTLPLEVFPGERFPCSSRED